MTLVFIFPKKSLATLIIWVREFNIKYMGHNNQGSIHFKKFLDWTVIQFAERIRGRNY